MSLCDQCQVLLENIRRAEAEHDPAKVRVMKSLYTTHLWNEHPETRQGQPAGLAEQLWRGCKVREAE